MRSIILFVMLSVALLIQGKNASAQYVASDTAGKEKPQPYSPRSTSSLFDKVTFGGNFGASFDNNTTYVEVSPLAIYQVNDALQIGPGLTFIYFNQRLPGFTYTSNQYGGRFFGRYSVYTNIYAHAEVEALSIYVRNAEFTGRTTIFNPLIGAGYRLPLGDRGGIFVTALYNLNYDESKSIYPSPLIFRIGFAL